jgi:predicted phosphoribosyltransferase
MVPTRVELSHGTPSPRGFTDRADAGRQLAEEVARRVDPAGVVVLGLPRGGVPVASEIARRLRAPLDVLVVRKLGVPWQPELAFGAVSAGDVLVYDDVVLRAAALGPEEIDAVVRRERRELERRERLYRADRPPLDVRGRTVVLVDDGIATGSTVRAGLRVLERMGAVRRVVACPVAPPETVRRLEREADEVVCLLTPRDLGAIGLWYRDFAPVEDDEVVRLLAAGSGREAVPEVP